MCFVIVERRRRSIGISLLNVEIGEKRDGESQHVQR